MIVSRRTATAIRIHHAGLGEDLQGTVNFECAMGDDLVALSEARNDDHAVVGLGTEHHLAPLEGRLIRFWFLNVNHGAHSGP